MSGLAYTATFSAASVSAAQDVFEIVAPSTDPLFIKFISLGQYSDFGDAQAEILSVLIIRGYTTSGSSGGTPPTPQRLLGGTGSNATVEINNTSVAANGSPITVWADSFNVAAGWVWPPAKDMVIGLAPSERLVVRITAPADALTMNGTISWEEGRVTP